MHPSILDVPKEMAPNRPSTVQYLADVSTLGLSPEYTIELHHPSSVELIWQIEDRDKLVKFLSYYTRRVSVAAVWPFESPAAFIDVHTRFVKFSIRVTPEIRSQLVKMDLLNSIDVRFILC